MSRRVKTTETSFKIVELLKKFNGATMNELSDQLELANSTVHGHLKTLEENQLLVKEGDKYHLSLQFFYYGNYARQRKPEYRYAEDHVENLVSMTKEGANFAVEEHGRITILYGNSIPNDPTYDVGGNYSMHDTASGKAILAEMSDEEVSSVIDQWGLSERTEHTITNEEDLFDELETIRRQGYALNHDELMPGLSAVAVVVERPDSSIAGALSVGGPTYRVASTRLEDEFLEALQQVKAEFEDDVRSLYRPS
ncbi:IclR family transcriptional regulator [Natronosalvus rutilus]|uniref:IclR family transcriptional regulator n=1 Tax=Natronosalvus rutilus TaxID=2953753 RepID=A0A9E7NE45_9EURY|nr:IclR family transcriptional regulator [Natronosalvus rutilus]UTF55816.1 IclR family transcriptional regulator [Natronosalvus rutilus]